MPAASTSVPSTVALAANTAPRRGAAVSVTWMVPVPRLFRPFQRLDGNRVRRTGHGLGLAIVRAIADAHGADLTPATRPDGGLTITLDFAPADRPPTPDA